MKNSPAMHIPCKTPQNQTNHRAVLSAGAQKFFNFATGSSHIQMHVSLVCIFWGTPWCRILHISLGAAQDVAPARLFQPVLAREEDRVGTRPCLRTWTSSTLLPKPRIPIKGVLLQQNLLHWCCKCVLPNITEQMEYTCFTSYMHCLHNSPQRLYFHICSTMIYFT